MKLQKSALVLAAALMAISGTQAGTVTSSLAVSINASALDPNLTCSFPTPTYTSPAYISGATTSTSVNITPLVTCSGSNPVTYTVHAAGGEHAWGGTRRAVSGSNFINYNLKQGTNTSAVEFDQSPSPNFGGSPMTVTTAGGAGNSAYFGFRLVVPANQTVTTGTYTDAVVLTMTF